MQYLWLILALFYAVAHAAVSVIDKKILHYKNIDPLALSTIRCAVNTVISFMALALFIRTRITGIDAIILLISILKFFSVITYFYALKHGDVSKLIPYRDAITTILSFSLAFLVLGENVALIDIIGVAAITLGGYIIWTDGKVIIPKKSKGIVLIGATAVFMSLHGITTKMAVINTNPVLLSFYMYALITLYFVATSLHVNRKNLESTGKAILDDKKLAALVLSVSATAVVGVVALFYALSLENATKVLPVAGTLPLFAAIMGKRLLNEKHGKERIAGASAIILGVFLLYL